MARVHLSWFSGLRKKQRPVSLCLGAVAIMIFAAACSKGGPAQPPFTPRDALEQFRIDGRFAVELFAAEPLLDGPVALAFDEKRRLFVIESPVFPPKASDSCTVKLLEDTNGDGRPDRAVPMPPEEQPPNLLAEWRNERGRTTDPSGNMFVTSPRSHVQVLVPGSEPRNISDHGESAGIFPLTENPVYPVLTSADRTTSTCGIVYYSNSAVPGFERALFTAEPVHNLVHCDLLYQAAQTFVAIPARARAEFLASSDSWFRPVSFAAGRDGSLYVVDYYAPLAGPAEVLEVGIKPSDYLFRASGKGRIYKITAKPVQQPLTGPEANPEPDAVIEPEQKPVTPSLPKDPAGLGKLIGDPREVDTAQAAAIQALGDFPGEAPAAFLLSRWRALTSMPRAEAVEALFKEPARLGLLLDTLEKGQIPLWCLDDEHRIRLLSDNDHTLAARTRRLLESHDPASNPLVKKYEAALFRKGNREAGETLYRRLCGRCHTYRGGSNYGPDLWTVASRPLHRILTDILLPSNAMAPGRELFMIDLKGGGGVEGVIGSQTATALIILHDESRQETVLRADIQRLLMSDFSAMPVDFATQITVEEMADLLRFLTSR